MTTEIHVMIAEDHHMYRERLRQAIESEPGFTVIAEAMDGVSALDLLRELRPEIFILDIHMRERSGFDRPRAVGFDLARAIRQQQLPIKIIFLTMDDSEEMLDAALNLGAHGYLLKESLTSEIIAGVKAVAAGKRYISPQVSDYLLDRNACDAALVETIYGLKALTHRELEVLALIVEGKSSKEIATELQITAGGVDNHRTSVSRKFDLHGPHDLLKFVLKHKAQLSQAIEAARRLHS